jgi:RES domain
MADPAGASRSRRAAESKPKVVLASAVPAPPAVLHITPAIWKAGTALHRVHLDVYAAGTFNPGIKGNARFSPIVNAAGKPIPTLYGGTSFNCAAMETVFHDVPFAPGLKTFARHKLEGQLHSVLAVTASLTLADMRNVPLRKLGVERKQLIDTEKDTYGQTRKWAQAIHAQHANVQGLCWTSRQDDSAMALMLFGDRIGAGVLVQQGLSRALADDAGAIMELLALADLLGVRVVADRA